MGKSCQVISVKKDMSGIINLWQSRVENYFLLRTYFDHITACVQSAISP